MHEGHRSRMRDKLENGETLYDHEILEILLYSVYPRVDTNPIAHGLLDRFGSLAGVMNAERKELQSVKGVGENVASYIKTVAKISERIGRTEGVAVLKTFGDCKNFVSMRLKGKIDEHLELYFLDKSGCVKRIFSYTSSDRNKVVADLDEISRNIALSKPYGILIAHNHVNGYNQPSENDDDFTKSMQLVCNVNKVVLWDHIIYSGDFYSYKDSGRLDKISKEFSLGNVLKWKTTSN